jgi:hypothetical protein
MLETDRQHLSLGRPALASKPLPNHVSGEETPSIHCSLALGRNEYQQGATTSR